MINSKLDLSTNQNKIISISNIVTSPNEKSTRINNTENNLIYDKISSTCNHLFEPNYVIKKKVSFSEPFAQIIPISREGTKKSKVVQDCYCQIQ